MFLTLYSTRTTAQGFSSVTNLTALSVSATTGEKPQSKVWTYDGKWWCVMPNGTGTHLWRLDGTTWTDILTLSASTSTHADCKVSGAVVHILLYDGTSSSLVSVEYVPMTMTYQLWTTRPSTVALTLDAGVETATIDIDGTGRMWVASAGVADINVRWSDSPYSTWSSAITIATGVADDDICAVVYLPGKIGVLWSNQNTQRFGFKTHTDGNAPATWSADEIPASQSALNVGLGMSDDHLNMAVASDGTLYCAVKTSYDTPGYPKIALLVRQSAGTWDNLYTVSETGTRPIILLNESVGKIKIFYSSTEGGGNILYKESSTSSISLSAPLTLISGTYNDVTSTKQNYSAEVVILASNATQAVGVLATYVAPVIPPAPILLSPADASTGIVVPPMLNWNTASGANTYRVQVSTVSDFTSTVFDQSGIATTSVSATGLLSNTLYYWRVNATNGAGTSPWSSTWSFTTAVPSGPLVCHLKMDEGSGTTLIDASPYNNNGTTVGSPTWATGVIGQALSLNGTQNATVADANSLDITSAITLAAWIRPTVNGTQRIIIKVSGSTGYELFLEQPSPSRVSVRFNGNAALRVNSTSSYMSYLNTWIHIAATYDGTTIRLYFNGIEEASLAASFAIGTNATAVGIGGDAAGANRFTGLLDDARIYNTALTAAQVLALATIPPPDAPVLASPSNGATGISTSPTLSWNASAGASTYQVQVSTVSDFSTTVFDQSGIVATSVSVPGLADNTLHYWRVNATNGGGTGSWSTTWSFTTATAPSGPLVCHLQMEEGSGMNLNDSSPYGNNGTTIGSPTWTTGKIGQALSLDGSTQYATVADASSLDISTAITLAAWVKPAGASASTQYVIKKATQGGVAGTDDGYEISLSSAGKVFVRFNQATSGDTYRINSVTSYPLNSSAWMHIAATYDQNTGLMKLYVNGVQESGDLAGPAAILTNNLPLGIGAQGNGVSKFNGLLDDVRVYNTALTASQILALATVAPNAPVLAAPANTATGVGLPPTLSWNASAGADTYQVQVSIFSDFSSTVYDQSGIAITSTSVAGLSDNTLYYWRVNATNTGGTSPWSTVWSFTTGTSGSFSLDLNGTNNYVDCGNDASLHVTNFTLEAWIKIEGAGTGISTGTNGITDFVPIISKGRGDTEDPVKDVNFALGYQLSTNKLAADFEDNQTSSNHPTVGNSTLGNCWTHVAATYDVSGIWKLYINGALDQTVNLGSAFTPQSLSDVKAAIGTTYNYAEVTDGFFNGLIDEVRIWNVVRTDAEIAASYTAELNSGAGLAARYGLNTGSGSVAVNSSGPNGSIAGTAVWVPGFVPGAGGTADAGGPYSTCGTTPVNIMATTNSTGSWSGGLGMFGSTTSTSTTYTPDVTEIGSDVTLTWTTDAGACDPVSDDATLTVDGAGSSTSLDFNGSTDYVSFGAAPELNTTTFTLEAWIKIEGAGMTTTTSGVGGGGFEGATAAVPIVTKGRGESDTPANLNMNYFMGLVGNKLAADFEESGGLNHSVIGNAVIPSNVWTHVAATYDPVGANWNLYINGALDKTLNIGSNILPVATSIQHAGVGTGLTSTGVAGGFFDGKIDEVRIWNVVRTPTEILNNYALELTSGTGLIGRWGFNEGCGLTATNSVPAGSNGTLSSGTGPVWSTDIPSGPVAPDAPTLLSPANAATGVALPPTLMWNAASGATSYRIQISFVSDFSSTEYDQSGIVTTSNLVPGLFENTLYYWRVNATNAGGTSPWSTVWSFTTASTGAFALDFNGSNNYVDLGNDASLHLTNFTLEAWVKIEGTGVSTSTGSGGITDIVPIISKGRAEAEAAAQDVNYFLGYQLSTNKLVADFEDNVNSGNHPASSNATLGNCWTHVAATYDVSGVWKLYINGVLDQTTNLGGSFTPQSLSEVKACIGSSFNSTGATAGFFNGLIDEVRIWNLVRTDAQIAADYDNDLISGSGLAARYGFNTGSGSVAVNSAGPNGSIGGTPVWVAGYTPSGTTATSLDFNGTSDYVTFGAAPALNASAFTLEAWIKIQGTGVNTSTGTGGLATVVPIVSKGRGEAETPANLNMNYFMGISGSQLAADFEEGSGPNHPVTGNASIPSNTWTHVAVTYDPVGAIWNLYINGVLDKTLDIGSNILPASTSIQHAGVGTAMTSTGAAAGFFNGLIDEVRIWNVVRTPTEIFDNYTAELASGAGLIGRWGFNDGCGLTAVNSIPSSPNGTLSSVNGPVWVSDTPITNPVPQNHAPSQPSNPSPGDYATASSTSPDLCVDVSDPDGDEMRVRYYGRPKGTAGAPFTIVWLPDTQYYVEEPPAHGGTPAMFNSQTAWAVNNEVAENIVFVGQLGDCVEHGDYPSNPPLGIIEWNRAMTAMYALEPPDIPYGVCAGNHDQSPTGDPNGSTTGYNNTFGIAHFTGKPYYGGHFGANNDNHYELFSASGLDFMVISFEYDQSSNFNAAAGPLDWAEALVIANPNKKVIVMSHFVLSDNGSFSTQGQYIYNRLKVYPNFIMMVGGHDPGGDGEARRTDVYQGNTVHTILADYQGRTNGGNGLMRIFKFDPAINNVSVKTYSPFTNTYEQDASSEFDLAVGMGGNQAPFTLIGELNNVASGTSPCLNWPGLDGCTEYEWYVEVFDGNLTTTGPVWNLITPGSGTATITPDGPTTFCAGGSVTLTASTGESYLWSTSETTQSIVVSTTGSYTVAVTDAGCTTTSTATEVTVNSLPTVECPVDMTVCIDATPFALTGGIRPRLAPGHIPLPIRTPT